MPVSGQSGQGIAEAWREMERLKGADLALKRREQHAKWIWTFAKNELEDRFSRSGEVRNSIERGHLGISEIIESFCKEELAKIKRS